MTLKRRVTMGGTTGPIHAARRGGRFDLTVTIEQHDDRLVISGVCTPRDGSLVADALRDILEQVPRVGMLVTNDEKGE